MTAHTTGGAREQPGAPVSIYLPEGTIARLDNESRRLNYEYGGVSRSRLVGALVDVGFDHLSEVVTALRREGNGRTHGRRENGETRS
jgi:hypothetical protein